MDLKALRDAVSGAVVAPGDPAYETARKPMIARYHEIRPRAVVRCETPEDVAATLDFAVREGLPVVPRSGGHCFAGRSSTEGLVVDVSPMRSVSVAPDGLATVGAGTRLAGLYDGLSAAGRVIPAGCGTTVGIAGLVLGGGIGLLGRTQGLTSDALRAAQVVLADGRVLWCDAGHDAGLFWALRGAGGGQFGIVTSLVFETVPEPMATLFELEFPYADAPGLISAWQHWSPDAPDELTAVVRLTSPGHLTVSGVLLDPDGSGRAEEERTAALVGDLGRLAGVEPLSATYKRLAYRAVKGLLAGPDEPVTMTSRSEFFRAPMPDDAVRELVRLASAAPGRELAFTPLGGAYGRVPVGATAFAHRSERFLLEHVGSEDDGAWVDESWRTAHPHASGRVYANFPDPALEDPAEAYHGENHERLVRVKHAYDPARLFTFPQSV